MDIAPVLSVSTVERSTRGGARGGAGESPTRGSRATGGGQLGASSLGAALLGASSSRLLDPASSSPRSRRGSFNVAAPGSPPGTVRALSRLSATPHRRSSDGTKAGGGGGDLRPEVSVVATEVDVDDDGMVFEVVDRGADAAGAVGADSNAVPVVRAVASDEDNDDDDDEDRGGRGSGSPAKADGGGGGKKGAEVDEQASANATTAYLNLLSSTSVGSGTEGGGKMLWCASRGTQCELMRYSHQRVRRRSSFEGVISTEDAGARVKTMSVYARARPIVEGPLPDPFAGDADAGLPPAPSCATDEIYCVPVGDFRAHRAQMLDCNDTTSDDSDEYADGDGTDADGHTAASDESHANTPTPTLRHRRQRRRHHHAPRRSASSTSLDTQSASAASRSPGPASGLPEEPGRRPLAVLGKTIVVVEPARQVRRHHEAPTAALRRFGPNCYSTGLASAHAHQATTVTPAAGGRAVNASSGAVAAAGAGRALQGATPATEAKQSDGPRLRIHDRTTMTEVRAIWKRTTFVSLAAAAATAASAGQQSPSAGAAAGGVSLRSANTAVPATPRRSPDRDKTAAGGGGGRRRSSRGEAMTSPRRASKTRAARGSEVAPRASSLALASPAAESRVALGSRFSVASPPERRAQKPATGAAAGPAPDTAAGRTGATAARAGLPGSSRGARGGAPPGPAGGTAAPGGTVGAVAPGARTLAVEYYEGMGIVLRPLPALATTAAVNDGGAAQAAGMHLRAHTVNDSGVNAATGMGRAAALVARAPDPAPDGLPPLSPGGVGAAFFPRDSIDFFAQSGLLLASMRGGHGSGLANGATPPRLSAAALARAAATATGDGGAPLSPMVALPAVSRPFEVEERTLGQPRGGIRVFSAKDHMTAAADPAPGDDGATNANDASRYTPSRNVGDTPRTPSSRNLRGEPRTRPPRRSASMIGTLPRLAGGSRDNVDGIVDLNATATSVLGSSPQAPSAQSLVAFPVLASSHHHGGGGGGDRGGNSTTPPIAGDAGDADETWCIAASASPATPGRGKDRSAHAPGVRGSARRSAVGGTSRASAFASLDASAAGQRRYAASGAASSRRSVSGANGSIRAREARELAQQRDREFASLFPDWPAAPSNAAAGKAHPAPERGGSSRRSKR
jgi:hypothetical protein